MVERFQKILDNGLKIWFDPKPLGDCKIQLNFSSGSIDETIPSTAHLIEHIQGCTSTIYGNGSLAYSNSNAYTSLEALGYYFGCIVPEDFEDGLELIARVFDRPDLKIMERERAAVRHELLGKVNPFNALNESIFTQLFPNHAKIMKSISQELEGLPRITEEAIIEYWNKFYDPRNAVLYLGGELPENVEELVGNFASTPQRSPLKSFEHSWPMEPDLSKRLEIIEKLNDKPVASINIHYQIPLFPHDTDIRDWLVYGALIGYLNKSHGPLYSKLRDSLELVYRLSIETHGSGRAGRLLFSCETGNSSSWPEIESAWQRTINDIANIGIPNAEYEMQKKNYRINLIHNSQSFDITGMESEFKNGITKQEITRSILGITSEDIRKKADEIRKKNYIISVVLPKNA